MPRTAARTRLHGVVPSIVVEKRVHRVSTASEHGDVKRRVPARVPRRQGGILGLAKIMIAGVRTIRGVPRERVQDSRAKGVHVAVIRRGV
jgi:hypothetical protein